MRLIVLEHEPDAPAGLLADWARERAHEVAVTPVKHAAALPRPADGDVLVSLGSDCSLTEAPAAWLEAELAALRSAHDAGRPVLGICFGGQALAAALGGTVTRAPRVAIEWSTVRSGDPALIGTGPWFRWHEDVFTVPPGARDVADAGGAPMAFTSRAAVGLQFHPEVTAEIAEAWIAGAGRQLAAEALAVPQIRERIATGLAGSRERAFALFDALAARWREQALV